MKTMNEKVRLEPIPSNKKAGGNPLFTSAETAVKFAVNFSSTTNISRSAMLKLMNPPCGSGGKGLGGLDGAAQAGMILAEVKRVGEFGEACIIARTALRMLPCSCRSDCCGGHKPNWMWMDAISVASNETWKAIEDQREPGKRGDKNDAVMRRMIVAKYFGASAKIGDIARKCDVTDLTIINHRTKIMKVLKKAEGEAWMLLESYLQECGVIE